MYLAVGLGNPGKEYVGTRHNIGFEVSDALIKRSSDPKITEKHQAIIAAATIGLNKILIAKPQAYMNNSGIAVSEISKWHKILIEHIIVVYDDADLDLGQIRIRKSGGSGGHNGVESIIAHLNSPDFIRVRIGIGRSADLSELSEYVLGKIPKTQREALDNAVIQAADAVEKIIMQGLDTAMNEYNRGVA